MSEDKITIERDILKKLVNNFYKAYNICDELNISEVPKLDDTMEEMKEWTDEQFGGKF